VPCALSDPSGGTYELQITPPAARALGDRLTVVGAAAVIEFLTTALVEQPQRVGKPPAQRLRGSGSRARARAGLGGPRSSPLD
jgi:mRNA interferase RelE/StbE